MIIGCRAEHAVKLQHNGDDQDGQCTAQHVQREINAERLENIAGQDDVNDQIGQAFATLIVDDAFFGKPDANDHQQCKLCLQGQQAEKLFHDIAPHFWTRPRVLRF